MSSILTPFLMVDCRGEKLTKLADEEKIFLNHGAEREEVIGSNPQLSLIVTQSEGELSDAPPV